MLYWSYKKTEVSQSFWFLVIAVTGDKFNLVLVTAFIGFRVFKVWPVASNGRLHLFDRWKFSSIFNTLVILLGVGKTISLTSSSAHHSYECGSLL